MKWLHDADTDQWNTTTDEWRMGVQQSIYNTDWYGWIERRTPPHDRHESYACGSAMEARKWCEAELARW